MNSKHRKKPQHRPGRIASPALIESLSHPIRRQILRILSGKGEVQSPSEIAKLVKPSLSNLAYHARCLREQNIIRCTGTKQARGSTQHLYASNVWDNKLVNTILSETAEDDSHFCRRSGK
jgi:DNA-binding transcriptional ArsR family regulator